MERDACIDAAYTELLIQLLPGEVDLILSSASSLADRLVFGAGQQRLASTLFSHHSARSAAVVSVILRVGQNTMIGLPWEACIITLGSLLRSYRELF